MDHNRTDVSLARQPEVGSHTILKILKLPAQQRLNNHAAHPLIPPSSLVPAAGSTTAATITTLAIIPITWLQTKPTTLYSLRSRSKPQYIQVLSPDAAPS
jgi:hypothetical protein